MGLSKLKMELIKSEKSRLATFHRRKTRLEKKSRELSTLCSIKVCMITYGLDAKTAELWPPNYNHNKEINELITDYKSQSIRDRKRRTVDSSHYFNEQQKKAEDLVEKARKENGVAKYPSWDYRYDGLSEEHLRNFVNYLDGKIKAGKARIAELKDTRTKIDQSKILEPSELFLNSYDKDHSKMLELSGTFLNSYDNDQSNMLELSGSFLNSYDKDHSKKLELFGTFLNSCDNDQTKMLEPSEAFLNSYDNNQSKMLEPSGSFMNPMMMNNNNDDDELCGPSIMYVPVQVCYLPSAAMPIQLMPHQYVPYTLAAAQVAHSQPNVWYQASDFQMNN